MTRSLVRDARTRIFAAGGALVFALALGACANTNAGAQSPQSSASRSNAPQGAGGRAKNQKLGVSYVVPQGFKEVTGGPDIPDVLVTTFVLGEPDPSKIVTQFMLTKLQGPHDYDRGTSSDMDNTALLEAFAKEQSSSPVAQVEGEPELSEWQGALPGASALVKSKNEKTGEDGEYEAFLGSGDKRWSVRGSITTLPAGTSIESIKAELDEFAKSIRPL